MAPKANRDLMLERRPQNCVKSVTTNFSISQRGIQFTELV